MFSIIFFAEYSSGLRKKSHIKEIEIWNFFTKYQTYYHNLTPDQTVPLKGQDFPSENIWKHPETHSFTFSYEKFPFLV